MCGIAGIFDFEGRPPDVARLDRMLEVTGHRGPDHRGRFADGPVAIGYNRLAILDLSAAGYQPMPNRARTAWIVYNGEVYNYLELMQELRALGHTFASHGDTEVILAAYDQWGTDCLRRLNGMWALAIWDSEKRRLFCARDRFGVKPFYMAEKDGALYFASEIKALLAAGVARPRPREESLYEFLTLGFTDTTEATCFEEIRQLPAAHALEITRDGVTRAKWYDIEPSPAAETRDAPERFRDLFLSSVELRLRSDVPVGTCLSGGLDSSSIVAAVTRFRERIRTFSIYYEGMPWFDERPFITEMTRDPKVEPFLLDPTPLVTPEVLRAATRAQEEPVSGASPVSQYFVMKLAKESGMTVLLDGQGGDEVLGGYLHFIDALNGARLRKGRVFGVAADLSRFAREQGLGPAKTLSRLAKILLHAGFGLDELARFEARARARFETPFTPRFRRAGHALGYRYEEKFPSRLSDVLYNSIFVKSLPQLLRYEDRNSMAFSIEARVPFLDYRLVEFAFSLPDVWKIRGTETKRVLREGLAGILPEKIRRRRDKRGFVTPGDAWLRGPLREFARETFRSERFDDNGILFAPRVRRLFEEFLEGRNRRGGELWRYLSYAVWLETFVP